MSTQFAVIFDFDDTLAEDSTAALVNHFKMQSMIDLYADRIRDEFANDQSKVAQCFYDEVTESIATGWDPSLAYTTMLVDKMRQGQLAKLRKADFEAFGRQNVVIYDGVPEFLKELRAQFQADTLLSKDHCSLDYYIVSGGVADIIRGTPIAEHFKEIWACEFEYDTEMFPVRPKSVISFTEKTKCLFCISKGIEQLQSWETPYAVNAEMDESDRPVPLSHMVYIGDGASDIPCMSLLKHMKGQTFLLLGPKTVHKAWEIGDRGHHCPRDFRGWGKEYMISGILDHARKIAGEKIKSRNESLSRDVGYGGKKTPKKRPVK